MADLSLLSKEDLNALASRNIDAMSPEGKSMVLSEINAVSNNKEDENKELQEDPLDEISIARKISYGFEKGKSDVGLLYRTLQVKNNLGQFSFGKNGIEYKTQAQAYGPNFVNASPEIKAEVLARLDDKELAKNYPILSQQESPGGWAAVGSFAGSLFSPTTLIPIGAAGKVSMKALAAGGAAFGAEYNILDQLASTAKVDPKQVAAVAGISAIATPAVAKSLSVLGTGIASSLAKRSVPKEQVKANDIMREAQLIINEHVALLPEGQVDSRAVVKDVLPKIQKKLGLTEQELKNAQVTSDIEVRIPGSRSMALSQISDQAQSLNPFTASNVVTKSLRDFVGVLSTDISRISSVVGGRLKKHDAAVGIKTANYNKRVEPFIKLMQTLPSKELSQVNRHLVSEDFNGAKAILSRYDNNASTIVDDTQKVLKDIEDDLRESGFKFGKIENYFPAKIISYKDFLNSIGKELKNPIDMALKARAEKLGYKDINALPIEETENVISQALRSNSSNVSQKSLSNKSRKVVVDDELIKQYKKPQDSLSQHILESVSMIEKRKFFGKSAVNKGIKNINLEDSVDNLIAKEISNKSMASDDFGKLKELIEARFGMGEQKTGAVANGAKNLIYQMTIANPMSALTQIADMGMSVFANGLLNTVKGALGKRKIKLEDLNLDQVVSAEMGTVGAMARMLDRTFAISGFKAIDRLGKETLVNAAYSKFQKMAKSDAGVKSLRKRFGKVFDSEFDAVLSDLRSGQITDNVKMMMFSELSNFQPIALSEMPLKYLQADGGRVFYALKSFTIKQFDVMRREIFHEFAAGNTLQGTKKLIAYATILPLAGASVQELKDYISRDNPISIDDMPDQMIKNALKIMGTSQYVVKNNLAQGKIAAAIGEAVLPPISLFDAFSEDLMRLSKGELTAKDSQALQRVPFFGRLMQDFVYGAREEKRIKDILAD